MKISREEALKIAAISRLTLAEDEVDAVLAQLAGVLEYAKRVQDLSTEIEDLPSSKNINVTRDGSAHPSSPELILACAPEREENYFVVPRILENK